MASWARGTPPGIPRAPVPGNPNGCLGNVRAVTHPGHSPHMAAALQQVVTPQFVAPHAGRLLCRQAMPATATAAHRPASAAVTRCAPTLSWRTPPRPASASLAMSAWIPTAPARVSSPADPTHPTPPRPHTKYSCTLPPTTSTTGDTLSHACGQDPGIIECLGGRHAQAGSVGGFS